MPEELRERLQASAKEEGRSLNREIVSRLEISFQQGARARKGRGEHVMLRKYRRPAFALGLVAIVAAALAVVAGVSGVPHGALKSQKLLGDPDRSRSIPGVSREGLAPATQLAIEQMGNKAYPAQAVKFGWQKGALDFFSGTIRNRGADGAGSWQLAGPSTAPLTRSVLNRTNADYIASGRVSALAIDPACTAGNCRLWVAPAAAVSGARTMRSRLNPSWTYVSGSFGTNAIGTLTYDAASHTLYAGTGEQNASADSEAGVGIYSSTDGGDSWTLLPGSPAAFDGAALVSSIVVPRRERCMSAPRTAFAALPASAAAPSPRTSLRAHPRRGSTSPPTAGTRSRSLYDDTTGVWGVNDVEIDNHDAIYMASVGKGIFRSTNDGSSWEKIFTTQDPGGRTEFALAQTTGDHTRIYGATAARRRPTQAATRSSRPAARSSPTPVSTAATRSTRRPPRR